MFRRPISRRGLFSRLFGRHFERGCFAVQIVLNAHGDDTLRARLHRIMRDAIDETPDEKRRFYKKITSLLVEAEPFFEYASFSYETDPDAAEAEYREWVSELEAAMATEEVETGADVDGYHRMSSDKEYVVCSLIFLLGAPHPWDHRGRLVYESDHGDVSFDPDDDDDYTRPKLGELIDSINLLDFETIEADAVFLMPGNEQDGFSWADLTDEGWEHLKMLRS